MSKHTIENGFDPHGFVGTVVLGLMVLLVLAAAAGKLGQTWLKWSVGLLLLGVIQLILGVASPSMPLARFPARHQRARDLRRRRVAHAPRVDAREHAPAAAA